MTATTDPARPPTAHHPEKALALALRLAHAEHALLTLTSGQVDAIVAPSGHTYLLRPAQEQLRQSERRLQAVIDSAADVITVVNRGGMILAQNPAISRVLGYEPAELVGSSLFKLIHPEDLPPVHSAFSNVIEGLHDGGITQFRHRAHDGSWRRIEATIGQMRDGSSTCVVFSLRPLAGPFRSHPEPVREETTLATAVQDKHRFLAMLSHELRTPLSPVLLGLDELLADERFAEAAPTLTMIRRNIELQSRLIEELSDFATVDQHKVRLRLEPIDLHEHVPYVLEICRGELAAAQVEVLLYLRAEETIVQADSVRLQQVMWNLVKNAAKFSTPGSTISITSANTAPGRVTLEFTDEGIGIEPALLPLVFDPFQQGEASTHQIYGGLGLGMFIAKGLAEAQGGTLTVSSGGRGKGTTFCLTLSIARSPTGVPLTAGTTAI